MTELHAQKVTDILEIRGNGFTVIFDKQALHQDDSAICLNENSIEIVGLSDEFIDALAPDESKNAMSQEELDELASALTKSGMNTQIVTAVI
ncbi:hypothetical protein THF1D04_10771 [Vibrio owensii]|uniref:Uncharacterized protein n=1 Tax=Vibrio owensii TaxID=696485 RepID=A0AAU9PYY1_9VIBR|nr:hypothetical protein THF1D04_10771 [Vibrio owensii]